MPVRQFRSLRRGVLIALAALALLLTPLGTGLARADDGYRYWGYYEVADNAWQFAQTAPGATVVPDGSVIGWRYAVSSMTITRAPRTMPAFNEVCGKVRPVEGQKRVSVIVDPGIPEEAPDGGTPGPVTATCVVAPPDATATQVLQTVAQVRTDDAGLLCGVSGYPANGCADPVSGVTIPANEPAVSPQLAEPAGNISAATPTWVWAVVGALIVVLAGTGVVVARKRRA